MSPTLVFSIAAVLFFAFAIGTGLLPNDGGVHGLGWMGVAIMLTLGGLSTLMAFSHRHSNRIYDRRRRPHRSTQVVS